MSNQKIISLEAAIETSSHLIADIDFRIEQVNYKIEDKKQKFKDPRILELHLTADNIQLSALQKMKVELSSLTTKYKEELDNENRENSNS